MDEFKPLAWQQKVMDDETFTLLIVGGIGCGKTRIGLEKVNRFCREHENTRNAIVTMPYYGGRYDIYADIITSNGGAKYYVSRKMIEYENGSKVYFGNKSTNWSSYNLNIVFIDNANSFIGKEYEDIKKRVLRLHGRNGIRGQIIVADIPPLPFPKDPHSLVKYLYGGENVSYHNPSTYDNHYLSETYVEQSNKSEWLVNNGLVK